jgi:hypothetical protein
MKCSKLASGGNSVAKIRSLIAGHDDLPVDEAVRVALAQRDGRLLIFERRLEAPRPRHPRPIPMPTPVPGTEYPN